MREKRIWMPIMLAVVLAAAPAAFAERQLSPRGKASAQVGGTWHKQNTEERGYTGGGWIDIDYGRPILRGRTNIFGSGASYGQVVLAGAEVWRAGANQSTQLTTEVPLIVNGKRLAPGSYRLFIDLKPGEWTLIVSKQPRQEKYDPNDKTAIWGSYGYDPKFDVVRVPMDVETTKHSLEQFTIDFVDVGADGGSIVFWWGTSRAFAPFRLAKTAK